MKIRERIAEVIGQSLGTASMCWDPIPKGVFESMMASKLCDKTVEAIIKLFLDSLVELCGDEKDAGEHLYQESTCYHSMENLGYNTHRAEMLSKIDEIRNKWEE